MPKYRITGPDGRIYRVTGPEGSTAEEALAQVQAQAGAAAPAPARAPEAPQTIDVAEGMSPIQKALVGAGGSVRKNYLAVRSLFPGGDLTEDEKTELAEYSKHKEDLGGWGTAGEIGSEIAQAYIPGGAVTRGLRAGAAGAARGAMMQAALRGAGETAAGAAYNAATALPGERGQAALLGGMGSAGGQVLNRTLGGIARPAVTPEARRLMERGIQPSLGQAIGGIANTAEEKLMSVPLLGDAISRARNRAVDEFNEAAIRTAAPGVRGVGDEALAAAHGAVRGQYDEALSRFPQQFRLDTDSLERSTLNAVFNPAHALSDASQDRLLNYVQRNLIDRSEHLTPEVAKRIESDLGAAVRRFSSSSEGEERAMGRALREVHQEWRNSLTGVGNALGDEAGTALREADAAWRAFLPLDKAAASAGAQGTETAGRFTPKMLMRALRSADKSANDRVTRGVSGSLPAGSPIANLNELARDATVSLSGRTADSGTAGRLGWGALALGGTAMLPKTLAALPLAYAGSTRAGQQALMEGIVPLLRSRGISDAAIQRAAAQGNDALMALARGVAGAGMPDQPQ